MTRERVVIDTNVLISGLLSTTSTPAQAVEKAVTKAQLVATLETLREPIKKLYSPKFDRYVRSEPTNADLKRKAYTACTAKMARTVYGLIKHQQLYRAYHEDAVPIPDGRTRSHGPLRHAAQVAVTS